MDCVGPDNLDNAVYCPLPASHVVGYRREDLDTTIDFGPLNLNPAAAYSPVRQPYTTIGAGELNAFLTE